MRTEIRDRNFNIIAYVETEFNGKKVLRDRNFRILGYYHPEDNTTRDPSFRIVGYGDMLTTLIPRF